jgi:2-polyprenyl-3-methyl-5-hydroxy-6-metoxy-1,4-benzoquinol methylase
MEEGILKLMEENFGQRLDSWLRNFEQFRRPGLQPLEFDGLPQSGIGVDKNIWNARSEDLRIISSIINFPGKTALDIGSWNGWLANQLANRTMEVTAIDYFIDEQDGMKAKKHYTNPSWNSIQMDLEDLDVISDRFDLIVVNRCFAYFTDRNRLINSVMNMLKPGGQLIITGLNLVTKAEGEAVELKVARKEYFERFDEDLMFKPFKGYVDKDDMLYLKSKGFRIYPYRSVKNLLKRVFYRKMTVAFYAIYQFKK